jgi:hypothetical protein
MFSEFATIPVCTTDPANTILLDVITLIALQDCNSLHFLHVTSESYSQQRYIYRLCLPPAFLLDLFFDHEDGGDKFLRNVG